MRKPASFVACVLLAAGCAQTPRAPEAAPPAETAPPAASGTPPAPAAMQSRTPSAPPPLAPPGDVSPRSASQVIHAIHAVRAATIRTAVQVDAAGLKVVGVTPTGLRIFTAAWDGRSVTAEKAPLVPATLDPRRVLADVQLALWPLESVRAAFAADGIEVTEPFAGVRRARRGGTLVSEVHYASPDPWNGRLWFVNFEFDYSLTIDTTTAPN